jgi:hypothetical protein
VQREAELVVELYVAAKLIYLLILIQLPVEYLISAFWIALYMLVELYVALLNIVFLSKYPIGAIPSLSGPPRSFERMLILVMFNAVEVTVTFALFYRLFLPADPGPWAAIAYSVQVFGTVGTPPNSSEGGLYVVAFQLGADFVLLAIFLAILIGHLEGFGRKDGEKAKPAKRFWPSAPPKPPKPIRR